MVAHDIMALGVDVLGWLEYLERGGDHKKGGNGSKGRSSVVGTPGPGGLIYNS